MLLHGKMIHQSFVLEEKAAEENPAPVTLLPTKVEESYTIESNYSSMVRSESQKTASGEKTMDKCPQCDYFGTLKGLQVHIRMHTAIRPFRCKECDFKCLTEDALDTHITDKHGNDEFACKECKYKGITIVGLARHYSRVHNIVIDYDGKENTMGNTLLPYSCDLCNDYVGRTERGLLKHKYVMHSEKLIKNNPDNVSEKHSIEENKDTSGGISEEASVDKTFSCSNCDFKGKSMQEIRKHILRKHLVKVEEKESKIKSSAKTPKIK